MDVDDENSFIGRFPLPPEMLTITEFTLSPVELLSLAVCRLESVPWDVATRFTCSAAFPDAILEPNIAGGKNRATPK